MHLLRSLLMVAARHSLVFSAVHIAGRCNRIADALSRFHWQANASSSSAAIVGGTFLGRLEQQCLHYMYAGLAASTRKTYRTAQRTCFNFCEMSGFVHANGSPCPANERTLCLFAAFLAESINHASIKVYLSAIRSLHIEMCHPDPLLSCLRLPRVVRGIRRSQGDSSSTRLPITAYI